LLPSAITRSDNNPACGKGLDEVRLQFLVSGLHSDKGLVTITVYPDDASRFLSGGGKLLRQRVPARQPVTAACIHLPAAG